MADALRVLELPVLGVPTRFEVDHASLLEAARETFGAWEALAGTPELLAPRTVTVRLLHRSSSQDRPDAEVQYRFPEPDLLLVTTPGSRGVADHKAGCAVAVVSDQLVRSGPYFRHSFLSALTLTLVTTHDRIPIHAAAVCRGDSALVLHGPSGVGKSSLALAAALDGLSVLSEDVVYAEIERGPRLWGMPGPVHVGESGLEPFPGVRPSRSVVRTGGKQKLAVDLPRADAPPLFARRVGFCLLRRSGGPPEAVPASTEEVRAALSAAGEPGFDGFREKAAGCAEFVSASGAWHLSLGPRPQDAVRVLRSLLDRLDSSGPAPA